MPITKYRAVEEMPGDHWYEPGDPELFRAMRYVWSFAALALPRHLPPGVHRHRSLGAANAQADAWEELDRDRVRRARGARSY